MRIELWFTFPLNIFSWSKIDVTIKVPPLCPTAAYKFNKIKGKLLQNSLRHTIVYTDFLNATEEQQ